MCAVESHLRKEVHSLRQQCSQFEGLLRHMRSQEDDLTSALEARDSQIHVLRVRLEECDKTIDTMRKKVEDREKEKERWVTMVTDWNILKYILNWLFPHSVDCCVMLV